MPEQTLRLEITGTDALLRVLRDLGPRAKSAAAGALFRAHEEIMTDAKGRTPVDTGALRASGHVEPSEVQGDRVVSVGGFGNQAVDYAIFVHEKLGVHHPVGEAKFYEHALEEGSRNLEGKLAADLRADLERRP